MFFVLLVAEPEAPFGEVIHAAEKEWRTNVMVRKAFLHLVKFLLV